MSEDGLAIARLEARVARLEKRLAERSAFLRALTRGVCTEDLLSLSLSAAGLPPLPRASLGLKGWEETTALSPADVESTMRELWRSVTPPEVPEEE